MQGPSRDLGRGASTIDGQIADDQDRAGIAMVAAQQARTRAANSLASNGFNK